METTTVERITPELIEQEYRTLNDLHLQHMIKKAEMIQNSNYRWHLAEVELAEKKLQDRKTRLESVTKAMLGEIEDKIQELEVKLREHVLTYYVEHDSNPHKSAYAAWVTKPPEIFDEERAVNYLMSKRLADTLKISKSAFNKAVKQGLVEKSDWWVQTKEIVVTLKGLGEIE